MLKGLFAVFFLTFCVFLTAQQAMNNDAVVKLVKAGISDDLIVAAINAQPGNYDTSADALNALKAAGASGKVLAAIVLKSAGPPQAAPAAAAPQPPAPAQDAAPELPPVSCNPQPAVQMSLCEFHLDGTGATENTGVMGLIPMMAAHSHNRSYFEYISGEVHYVYQRAIEESCQYQYVKNEKPGNAVAQSSRPVCVNVSPTWLTQVGAVHSRPEIITIWEVDGPGECKFKIKTTVVWKEKVKGLPNGADPDSKHYYLELSKQDVPLFLGELDKEIKQTGCDKQTGAPK